jgi:hypothetical protein
MPPENHDDDSNELPAASFTPPRLRHTGSAFDRRLLRSAQLDAPDGSSRERTLVAALGSLRGLTRSPRARMQRVGVWVFAALSLMIAGVWSWSSSQSGKSLTPRPEPAALRAMDAARDPTTSHRLPCPALSHGSGKEGLIDDFEDGNARLLISDGRSGFWTAYGDGTGTQTPGNGQTAFPERRPGGASPAGFALHLVAERLTGSGGGLQTQLAPGSCYDASKYDGVRFSARGPGRVYVEIMMIDVMEKKWGGLCESNCYDQHTAPVDLDAEWREYALRWKDFGQGGWGAKLSFDPARLLSMGVSVRSPDTPIDYWIDDVAFVPR